MFSLIFWGAIHSAHAFGLPLAASDVARSFDTLWSFVLWASVFFFVLIVGGMIYMAITYRARPGGRSKYITGNVPIEVVWTAVPTVLLLLIFAWGYVVYNGMTRPPSDAMEIRVVAKQWLWQFQYPDTGKITINDVYVPVNKPVKFVMSSEDVLHSFFVPNMRTKQDVVPGMYTSVWFEPTVAGRHQIFCTEYCGTSHSQMLANLWVLTPEQWESWKRGKKIEGIQDAGKALAQVPVAAPVAGEPNRASASEDQVASAAAAPLKNLAAQGRDVSKAKGCIACHSDDGTAKIGPSYKGLYDSKVELADGSSTTADENYLRESIEDPNAKIVKGFSPTMPPFKGLINETEMNALIAYIKSVK